jgi:hypothetical protein
MILSTKKAASTRQKFNLCRITAAYFHLNYLILLNSLASLSVVPSSFS